MFRSLFRFTRPDPSREVRSHSVPIAFGVHASTLFFTNSLQEQNYQQQRNDEYFNSVGGFVVFIALLICAAIISILLFVDAPDLHSSRIPAFVIFGCTPIIYVAFRSAWFQAVSMRWQVFGLLVGLGFTNLVWHQSILGEFRILFIDEAHTCATDKVQEAWSRYLLAHPTGGFVDWRTFQDEYNGLDYFYHDLLCLKDGIDPTQLQAAAAVLRIDIQHLVLEGVFVGLLAVGTLFIYPKCMGIRHPYSAVHGGLWGSTTLLWLLIPEIKSSLGVYEKVLTAGGACVLLAYYVVSEYLHEFHFRLTWLHISELEGVNRTIELKFLNPFSTSNLREWATRNSYSLDSGTNYSMDYRDRQKMIEMQMRQGGQSMHMQTQMHMQPKLREFPLEGEGEGEGQGGGQAGAGAGAGGGGGGDGDGGEEGTRYRLLTDDGGNGSGATAMQKGQQKGQGQQRPHSYAHDLDRDRHSNQQQHRRHNNNNNGGGGGGGKMNGSGRGGVAGANHSGRGGQLSAAQFAQSGGLGGVAMGMGWTSGSGGSTGHSGRMSQLTRLERQKESLAAAKPFEQWEVEWKRINHVGAQPIGAGAAGQVYRARMDKEEVAIKELYSQKIEPSDMDELSKELQIISRLNHPHVVKFYGVTKESGSGVGGSGPGGPEGERRVFLVTEYCPHRLDRLLKNGELSLDEVVRISAEVAMAVEYMHRHRMVHRDLKPENILLTKKRQARVADFGMSRGKGSSDDRYAYAGLAAGDMGESNPSIQLTGLAGTPAYLAPEMISSPEEATEQARASRLRLLHGPGQGGADHENKRSMPHGQATKIDVYAFGVMLNYLLTRVEPYSCRGLRNQYEVLLRVKSEGLRPKLPKPEREPTVATTTEGDGQEEEQEEDSEFVLSDYNVPIELVTLIERCWQTQPEARPSFSEILRTLEAVQGKLLLGHAEGSGGGGGSGGGRGRRGSSRTSTSSVYNTASTSHSLQSVASTVALDWGTGSSGGTTGTGEQEQAAGAAAGGAAGGGAAAIAALAPPSERSFSASQ